MPKAANLTDDEIALLSGHDDDFYGLWEVDWHFDGTRPLWSWEERRNTFVGLVQAGLMSVFFGPLQTARQPLSNDDALRRLDDPSAWLPPANGQTVGFYVTTSPAGLKAIGHKAE